LPEIALSAWVSVSSFAGSPQCAVTLTRNIVAPAFILFQSSLIASSKISASGTPTNVAFLPSPTRLFTAFSRALLSHKYSMGFVTGVPCNAKTKAASSGQFKLDSSSSHLPLLPFPLFPQVHTPCSHLCSVHAVIQVPVQCLCCHAGACRWSGRQL